MANLIKRSNQMNESHYRLKEVTQRVLALAIEQAQHIGIEKVLAGTKQSLLLITMPKFMELPHKQLMKH